MGDDAPIAAPLSGVPNPAGLLALATFSNFLDGAEPTAGYLGEVGGPWARNPQYTSGIAYVSKAERLYPTTGTAVYYPPQMPSTANMVVSSDLVFIAAPASSVGITARAQTGALTHYRLFYLNGNWYVQSLVANAASTITSISAAATVGHTYRAILSVTGASGSATLAWQVWDITSGTPTPVWGTSASDTSAVPAGGQGGTFNASGTSETTGVHHDNICIYATAAVTLEVTPRLVLSSGGAQTIAILGMGTAFTTTTPSFSLSGPGAAGCTLSGVSVVSATVCTATFTPGTTEGVVAITDSASGAIGYLFLGVPSLQAGSHQMMPGLAINMPIVNHTYSNWTATPPTITPAAGATNATFGTWTGQNGMAGYLPVDTHGAAPGTITFTDSVTGATGPLQVPTSAPVLPGATSGMPATDGASLKDQAGSNGATWTSWFSSAGQRLIGESAATSGLPANTVYVPGNLSAEAIYADGGGSIDQSISCDLFAITAADTNQPMLLLHAQSDAYSAYTGRYNYNGGAPDLEIKMILAGATTVITGTLTGTVPSLVPGTNYNLTFSLATVLNAAATLTLTLTAGGSTVATLTATSPGNIDQPGYAGIGFLSIGAQNTTTTGYRFGFVTIAGGPRAVDFLQNATANGNSITSTYTGLIQYPSIAVTPNYLHYTYEGRLPVAGGNEPSDQVYFRVPLGPNGPPGWRIPGTLLTNDGTGGTPAKINCYTGAGKTAYYASLCWVPGAGAGPASGRLCLTITRYPNGGTEGNPVVGNTPGLATTYVFMSWSDDEGNTWAPLVDITANVKSSTWAFVATSSGALIPRPGGGLLLGIGGTSGSSSSAFLGAYCCGTRNYDGTGWSQLGQIVAGGDVQGIGVEVALAVAADGTTLWAWTRPQASSSPVSPLTLVKSTDGGVTWIRSSMSGSPLPNSNVTCGLTTWQNAMTFVAPIGTPGGSGGSVRDSLVVTYSRDGGTTWHDVTQPTTNVPGGTTAVKGHTGNMQALQGRDGNLWAASDLGGGGQVVFHIAPSWAQLPLATAAVARRSSSDRAGSRGVA